MNGIAFNRVPNGPREQPPTPFPTRGALPTRLNECAILNRAEYIPWARCSRHDGINSMDVEK